MVLEAVLNESDETLALLFENCWADTTDQQHFATVCEVQHAVLFVVVVVVQHMANKTATEPWAYLYPLLKDGLTPLNLSKIIFIFSLHDSAMTSVTFFFVLVLELTHLMDLIR